jgi:hypothetical protein
MHKNENKIYLAYGSNLNLERMGYRCPYAVPLGPSELPGYRLMFRGCNGNAVATVEPMDIESVPALLWEITPRDEEALDRYEGWPRLYRKEIVNVGLNGKPVDAMVYVMNALYPYGLPGERYLNIILEGYASAGFDAAVLDEAVRVSNLKYRVAMRGGRLARSNRLWRKPPGRDEDIGMSFREIKREYVDENGSREDFH